MQLTSLLPRLLRGEHLDAPTASSAVSAIMAGTAPEAAIAAFLTALAVRGETEDELTGAATALRAHLTPVVHAHARVLDTCGTGGDGADTFNISTAAAFVCAAAGVAVGKHGNRSASSRVGSADVLEAAGVRLEVTPGEAGTLLDRLGFCFMFAPVHHGAMRHAAPVRRLLGGRTLFNLLGPLANPAGATHQLVGVPDPRRLAPMAHVLGRLGATRALVVCGAGGLDELSLHAPAEAALHDRAAGVVERLVICPRELGLAPAPLEALRGGDAAENARLMAAVLAGEAGPRADVVALNAGVALWVAEAAPTPRDGVARAQEVLASGAAGGLLARYVRQSHHRSPVPGDPA
jgi:anthranilate phosphoribosyltransferase